MVFIEIVVVVIMFVVLLGLFIISLKVDDIDWDVIV